MARRRRSGTIDATGARAEPGTPPPLAAAALIDTGVWTWVRDRRFRQLAEWFNGEVEAGRSLTCDLVVLELIRLAANAPRARQSRSASRLSDRCRCRRALAARPGAPARLATENEHRAVPPADLLIAAAAENAGVELIHYDRDYERIAGVSRLAARWLVPAGTLA